MLLFHYKTAIRNSKLQSRNYYTVVANRLYVVYSPHAYIQTCGKVILTA